MPQGSTRHRSETLRRTICTLRPLAEALHVGSGPLAEPAVELGGALELLAAAGHPEEGKGHLRQGGQAALWLFNLDALGGKSLVEGPDTRGTGARYRPQQRVAEVHPAAGAA